MLAPHLTQENATELLQECEKKTNTQVERLIADKVPQPQLLVSLGAHPAPGAAAEPGAAASRDTTRLAAYR